MLIAVRITYVTSPYFLTLCLLTPYLEHVSLIFQIELQIMARLSHPNIVRVYGGCLTPPNLFVVAELMEGDLSDLIHSVPQVDDGTADESVAGRRAGMNQSEAMMAALDIIRGLVRGESCHVHSPTESPTMCIVQPCA